MVAEILQFLADWGFTKEAIMPLLVLGLLAYLLFTKKLNKLLNPIKFAIVEIQTIFKINKIPLEHYLAATSDSPLKPTEFGWKLLKESGLNELLEKKQEYFLKILNDKLKDITPYTDYDVQEKAIESLVELKNEPIINPIKDYAFQNGIDVEVILRTGGLVLREKYFKKYPKNIKNEKNEVSV
ncbi:MAG: hypothetical protein ACKKMW_02270 [Candidatus Nealsonbacteria bacterium]